MRISVIIPTRNAEEYIEKLLLSLRGQTVKPEIIVIDSSSADKTPEIAKNLADVFVSIDERDFNHGLTRNLGVGLSKGDIVVFFSQDALPENEKTLEVLIKPIVEGKVVLSYARHIPPEGTRPTEVFFRSFSYPPRSEVRGKEDVKKWGLRTFSNSNVCCAYLKEKLLEVGGFPRVILSEDLIVAAKLVLRGYKIMYNAEARVIHAHEYSLFKLFQRYFSIGVFYAENKWLRGYGGRGDTLRFIISQMEYLSENAPFWIPYAIAENAFRVLGLLAGFNYKIFPKKLLPLLSGYKHYFQP
ncbi:MAG: glycosyltransferase [candidate division WOR-3 bacterium]